ncbi:4392_t:CDS:2 [Cetraspora pellucida]|uniref:4392_t:CDS:1 n=1 Tax=Cetraspora pellucida TaxID=1433469 RepID=A0ACA9MBG2_9GLOM|nr:4392_t:CDS:2 [Cetraspora pellucida]
MKQVKYHLHLKKVTLMIKNLPHPHTSNHIQEALKIGPFAKTIKKLEESQYSTISYIYPAIQKIKLKLSCSFDPINENNNNSQDNLSDAFDKLQINDEKNNESEIKPINTFELINIISKLYYVINVYYEDLELNSLVASLLDPC